MPSSYVCGRKQTEILDADLPELQQAPSTDSDAAAPSSEQSWRQDLQDLAASLKSSEFGSSDESDYYETPGVERVYLVGVQLKGQQSKYGYTIQESLEELGSLAKTAGLEVWACQ